MISIGGDLAMRRDCTADGVGHEIISRGKAALQLLLEAQNYAKHWDGDPWQFALDAKTLSRTGLPTNDLRWLLCQGLVAQAQEITLGGSDRRSFRPAGAMGFKRTSCFILTEAGMDFVRRATIRPTALNAITAEPLSQKTPKILVPIWDEERQELRLGDKVVKRYYAPAVNQQRILAVFQEEGWPCHIDDPLPPRGDQDPKRRLHDTIYSLNRHQSAPLIRFLGDGRGEGVCWDATTNSESV